jgi:hypothetical protein
LSSTRESEAQFLGELDEDAVAVALPGPLTWNIVPQATDDRMRQRSSMRSELRHRGLDVSQPKRRQRLRVAADGLAPRTKLRPSFAHAEHSTNEAEEHRDRAQTRRRHEKRDEKQSHENGQHEEDCELDLRSSAYRRRQFVENLMRVRWHS